MSRSREEYRTSSVIDWSRSIEIDTYGLAASIRGYSTLKQTTPDELEEDPGPLAITLRYNGHLYSLIVGAVPGYGADEPWRYLAGLVRMEPVGDGREYRQETIGEWQGMEFNSFEEAIVDAIATIIEIDDLK